MNAQALYVPGEIEMLHDKGGTVPRLFPFFFCISGLRFILVGERIILNYNFQSLEISGDMNFDIYGGVLSLFVIFSRTKNIKFVNIPIFGKQKKQENMED